VSKAFQGIRMHYEWTKRNIDLETLVKHVEEYLRTKGFEAAIPSRDSTRIEVLAIPTEATETRHTVRIELSKTATGISVNFASTSKVEESIKLGILSQFVLGGAIVAKSVSTKEKLEALETQFWTDIQEFIASTPA